MKRIFSSFMIFLFCGCMLFSEESVMNQETTEQKNYISAPAYPNQADSLLENMDSLTLMDYMGRGINLGNTLEATNNWRNFNLADASKYETAWGQPVTTKEVFIAYKKAGFDSVRIPVAWTNTMDWRNGDFEINKNYLERVATIVKYALDADLYVIINDHWDNGWWGLFGSDRKKALQIFDSIWDAVGTYFKDFSYKLIFEAGNEEWGDRFNDTVDGVHGRLNVGSQYKTITFLGQRFVDKIRAQGGNNTKRFLLIPGYSTDITRTTMASYVMPVDNTNPDVQKLLISVHYYTPSTYCILSEDASWGKVATTWGTEAEKQSLDKDFAKMTKFTSQGYGVIVGEYGVAQIKDERGRWVKKDGMEDWLSCVVQACDKYKYASFLWDCNTFFKKKKDADGNCVGFEDPAIAEVYKRK